MSTTEDKLPVTNVESLDNGNQEITDLEARKMNDTTFDTEDESDDQSVEGDENEDEEDLELDARSAAVDILDQLVELFIERNGREPNEEEVLQWIDVFKSLKIEDADEQTENESAPDEATANPTAEWILPIPFSWQKNRHAS